MYVAIDASSDLLWRSALDQVMREQLRAESLDPHSR